MTAEAPPLQILLTFDIEIWCGGWQDIDGRFPAAFDRYIYGTSMAGNYALPKTLEILNAHGLKGVFFVEPLFAAHFGIEPLARIVRLIREAGQEIQLHLHPEWQDEALAPLIPRHERKRQHLSMYDAGEQTALIGHGLRLLREADAGAITAFRAGSFACNAATYVALESNGIPYDCSLNVTVDHSGADLDAGHRRPGCHGIGNVTALPISVFRSGAGRLRHVQVGACAYAEIIQAMRAARAAGWRQFNLLSHNFEMLLPGSHRPDWTVVRRFERLCRFLHEHCDIYPTRNFSTASFVDDPVGRPLPNASLGSLLMRNVEQGYRRVMEYRDRQLRAGVRT